MSYRAKNPTAKVECLAERSLEVRPSGSYYPLLPLTGIGRFAVDHTAAGANLPTSQAGTVTLEDREETVMRSTKIERRF